MVVDGGEDGAEEDEEPGVAGRVGTRIEQVDAVVGGHGPVVVLARAVDAGEGLFVQQGLQAVALGDPVHGVHDQLVPVDGDVRGGEDRGELELVRGDLVMLGFGGDADLPELDVEFAHEIGDRLLDGAEIVVLHLLALGRIGAEKGPSGQLEVDPLVEEFLVDQEVLLLGSHGGDDALGIRVSEGPQHAQGLFVDRFHGAEQRDLLVQGLPGVGNEGRRDVEGDAGRVFLQEGGTRGVPGRVAAGLEGRADAAGGKGGGVGLALDKFLTGELHQDAAFRGRGDEGIVLFGGDSGQGLEPVRVVGRTLLDGPILHGVGNNLGHLEGQLGLAGLYLLESLVDAFRQAFTHDAVVEGILSIKLRERSFREIDGLFHSPSSMSLGVRMRLRGKP